MKSHAYTFVAEPLGLQIKQVATDVKPAHKAVWNSLTPEQRDACSGLDLIDEEESGAESGHCHGCDCYTVQHCVSTDTRAGFGYKCSHCGYLNAALHQVQEDGSDLVCQDCKTTITKKPSRS